MHKLTLKELKEVVDNHKVLWTWLADETLIRKYKVEKYEFFAEHGIYRLEAPICCCYCCEYDVQNLNGCASCPWGELKCFDSLFNEWLGEDDYVEAAELARQIANFPLKKKYVKQYIKECRESRDVKIIPDEYKENMMRKFMEVR